MKIVISPDSFKESLDALTVADSIEIGFKQVFPNADYVKLPMADGGEGTLQVLVDATQGQMMKTTVTGPLGEPVEALWGMSADKRTGFIEMAEASGIERVQAEDRNPLITTTYGTGELIIAALDHGVSQLIIGIGGSATNDGGIGMMQALGVSFKDVEGQELTYGGSALKCLDYIDVSGLDVRTRHCAIKVACDVTNPLIGPEGASKIFGPQKGATPEMVAQLDDALSHYADVMKSCLKRDVAMLPGAGAAGGLGAAFRAFLGADMRPGVDLVIEALKLEDVIQDASLVITGEGKLDGQSLYGKVPIGVAKVAKRYNKPVIAIAGSLSEDVNVVHSHGIDAIFSCLHQVGTLQEALSNAQSNLIRVSRNIASSMAIAIAIDKAD
ncbi:glycerate kinase [Photobacterium sagamiensis]|uniref:glycerate kinase n=1 Tax=Photobacterium sagamiensis TaxID=2910241 RepID=UPI003D100E61